MPPDTPDLAVVGCKRSVLYLMETKRLNEYTPDVMKWKHSEKQEEKAEMLVKDGTDDVLQSYDLPTGQDVPKERPELKTQWINRGKDNMEGKTTTAHSHPGGEHKAMHHVHGTPVFYENSTGQFIYVWAERLDLKQLRVDRSSGKARLSQAHESAIRTPNPNMPGGTGGMPGGFMTVSCKNRPAVPGTGIVWANHTWDGDANQAIREGVLRAFSADDVSVELWNNRSGYPEHSGNFAKFCSPTVSSGRVYQPSMGGLLLLQTLPGTHLQPSGTPSLARHSQELILAWANVDGSLYTNTGHWTWGATPNVVSDKDSEKHSDYPPSVTCDHSKSPPVTYLAYINKTSKAPIVLQSTDPKLASGTWSVAWNLPN